MYIKHVDIEIVGCDVKTLKHLLMKNTPSNTELQNQCTNALQMCHQTYNYKKNLWPSHAFVAMMKGHRVTSKQILTHKRKTSQALKGNQSVLLG